MKIEFREFVPSDKEAFASMVKKFYAPPAVLHFPPENVMLSAFDEAISNGPYIKGYIFEGDGETVGYSIVSMKFETEVGGIAAWIEELFVDEKCRGMGVGSKFFEFLQKELTGKIKRIRLEVGAENDAATRLYERMGFEFLEYRQMIIDKDF